MMHNCTCKFRCIDCFIIIVMLAKSKYIQQISSYLCTLHSGIKATIGLGIGIDML